MSIVSSTWATIATNADGSRIVHETHTDHTGKQHIMRWIAGASVDVNSLLATHATQIAADLADAEAQELMNG